jgi:hypothetical protein
MFTQRRMIVSYRPFGTTYSVKSPPSPHKSVVATYTAAEAWNRLFFLVVCKEVFRSSVYIVSKFVRICQQLISKLLKERSRDLIWNTLPVICLENGDKLRTISLIVEVWTWCILNTQQRCCPNICEVQWKFVHGRKLHWNLYINVGKTSTDCRHE